ncbi:glutathione S-transferase [Aliiruegeria haliotis]|uniref:Glutathione S-transferase n=1 Tax=Aliiruegeria haliotis TaxID=1280846 RepID=A0A2T0RSY9_9RHOB|nr:glutathione S-transferase [Aliiruegeria haliotis]PRY24203.1 glutathione S-transferase [Aliiruegeria haliotis]
MTYTLYYWNIPFRGHFPRFVLAHVGAQWEEPGMDALVRLKDLPPAEQPLPFVGPPLLHDRSADLWLSQMAAILLYLGEKHGLVPESSAGRAMTVKVLGDCTDVLQELTCSCGAMMWTRPAWDTFVSARLPRWMQMFEALGRANGLTDRAGHMLGTEVPGIADLATSALWHTMTDKLPPLAPLLREHAPAVAALSHRIAETPAISAMRAEHDANAMALYCAGQIEESLLGMLGTG